MKHIASCSFGKDSLATVLLALEHGEPLDEVVYCEVMFDDYTSGEVPEHRDFILDCAIPFLERNGVRVVTLRSSITFVQSFYRVLKKGANAGKLNAWPLCGRCCIQRDCKLPPIRQYKRSLERDAVQYIGIASDEEERLARLDGTRKVSLLSKYNLTEHDATELCRSAGLLSPIYHFAKRNGCFFCPNAGMNELRHLHRHHPELWQKLMDCQKAENKATELFNRSYRIDELDELFRAEENQLTLFENMMTPAA